MCRCTTLLESNVFHLEYHYPAHWEIFHQDGVACILDEPGAVWIFSCPGAKVMTIVYVVEMTSCFVRKKNIYSKVVFTISQQHLAKLLGSGSSITNQPDLKSYKKAIFPFVEVYSVLSGVCRNLAT